jgi:hypothetical protein
MKTVICSNCFNRFRKCVGYKLLAIDTPCDNYEISEQVCANCKTDDKRGYYIPINETDIKFCKLEMIKEELLK